MGGRNPGAVGGRNPGAVGVGTLGLWGVGTPGLWGVGPPGLWGVDDLRVYHSSCRIKSTRRMIKINVRLGACS